MAPRPRKKGLTAKRKTKYSAQQYLDIAEIRDGVVILNDGTFRAILMTSSLNFALKSEQEQEAIIYSFQSFLNSLTFPIQILIISRKLNITPYLEQLEERKKEITNELLRIQLEEYREYIKQLVRVSNVMTKTFYIIIPFAAQQIKEEGGFTKFYKMLMFRRSAGVYSAEEFERNKEQLWQRVEQVAMGLKNMNIRAVPLNTQEIIELFYMLYNPDISRHQRLAAIEELEIEEIQRLMTKEAPTPEEAERLYRLRRSMYM